MITGDIIVKDKQKKKKKKKKNDTNYCVKKKTSSLCTQLITESVNQIKAQLVFGESEWKTRATPEKPLRAEWRANKLEPHKTLFSLESIPGHIG